MHDLITLFTLGLVSGFSVCSLSCLAYLGPYLFCTGRGFQEGVTGTLSYLGGKTLIYSLLGGIATFSKSLLSISLETTGKTVMGLSLILIALMVPVLQSSRCRTGHRRISLMGLGISTSLIPCPIFAGVLVIAAEQSAVYHGALCGLVFGLGLMISPLLIAGGGISFITSRLKHEINRAMPFLKAFAMLMMATSGIRMLVE
jgi:cytochrome c-type biogenesis protein